MSLVALRAPQCRRSFILDPGSRSSFASRTTGAPHSDAVSRFSSLDPSVLPFHTFVCFNRDQVVFREVADQKPVTGYCGNGRLGSGKHWLPSLISTYLFIQEQFHWSKMIFLLPCHVPLCIPYPSVQDGGFRPFSQWSIKCNWPFHKVWMWLRDLRLLLPLTHFIWACTSCWSPASTSPPS